MVILILGCDGPYFKIPKEADSTPPLITITNPAQNEIVSDSVLIAVYAFDNDELEIVELYLNDQLVLAKKEGPFQIYWDTKNAGEDSYHFIQAKAIDINDNYNQTKRIQIFVDNLPNPDETDPNGVIIYPGSGQIVSDSVHWIIEASDNDSIRFVRFIIDGDSIYTDSQSPYEYVWETSSFSDKSYTLSAIVEDISANRTVIGPISVFVDNIPEPDTSPPIGNIINPPSSSTVSGVIPIKVSAYDNDSIKHVEFSINGELLSSDNTHPYEYLWDTNQETDQENHLISIMITDLSNNKAMLTTISVFVSNSPSGVGPIVNIISPASNQTVSGDVEISAQAYDQNGILKVEFYHNDNLAGTDTDYPFSFSWNTSLEIDDSDHLWTVLAYDNYENSTQSQAIVLYVDNEDNIAPTGLILYPYAGQHLSGTVEIQVSASDNMGISNVDFLINGSLKSTDETNPYTYNWNTNNEEDESEHLIQINILDINDNNTLLGPIAVYIDNDSLPASDDIPPVVSMLFPLSGQTVGGNITIETFVSDNHGISEVKFYINSILTETVVATPYSYDWDTTTLVNGSENSLYVKATDLSGNETHSQPILVIIEN